MSLSCLHATSGSNHHQKGVEKLSDTLKKEGWWTGTPQTINVIDAPQLKQRTDEWYAARNECYITGCTMDKVLNNNPNSTYYQAVNQKAKVTPEWLVVKKTNGDNAYTNPHAPKLPLDKEKLTKLYVPLPDSLLYVILDIEHTEGCYDGIEMIQLAAKLADMNGHELTFDPFNELVHTPRPIVDRCGHNITSEDLEGKDKFDKVGQRFIDWIDRAARKFDTATFVLVAYNGFTCDFRFLAREFERHDLVLPEHYHYLCMDPLKNVQNEMKGFFKDVPRRTEAGKPCLKLKDVTTFILEERELYSEDRERYEGGDVLFQQLCGTAHDAMADVEALHIILKDQTVWDTRQVIKFDAFTEYACNFVHYARSFAVTTPIDVKHKATNHGTDHEEDARKKYLEEEYASKKIKCKYIEIGFVKHPSPDYRYMGASPDGLILFKDRPPILIEIKCPYRIFTSVGKLERSSVKQYRGQMQLQMHVMGVHETHFVQYNPDPYELIFDVVQFDADFMQNPIFPQFVADVDKRKTTSLMPHPGCKKRASPQSKERAPPKHNKQTKRIKVIDMSDDED